MHQHCIQISQLNHAKKTQTHSFSHPKVRDSHLNRWSTLPTKITLLITPRCVPHILTGNMQSTKLQCLRQNANNADRCKHANSQPTVNACTTLHKTAKQITVVSVHMKPIDMSCSKNENQCKTHDSWHRNWSNSVSQVQILSSPKSSKTLKFQDISNCYSTPISAWQLFHHSFCISPRSCRRLPSLALPPGLEPL